VANTGLKFKARDIERAIRAARAAGLDPVSIEVDPHSGRITVTNSKAAGEQKNDLDQWMSKHADDA
jgi:hypothetical protein